MSRASTQDLPELLWNIHQIRAALGNVSRDTVERLFRDEAFPKIKMGQKTFAYAADVKAYVMRCAGESGRRAA